MIPINGSYINQFNKGVQFEASIPTKWEELDKMQFGRIIQILHFRKADQYTKAASLLALLFGSENWHILNHLDDEYLTALMPLTNFILEEKAPLKNFFPILNINKKSCIAPAEDLSNLSFGEWCFAHQYFIYYSITEDKQWLHKLIATIYRPVDPNQDPDSATYSGDQREVFNENLIEKRALRTAEIEEHIQLGVLTWFSCAVAEIAEFRPHVFPPAAPVDPEQPAPEIEPDNSANWLTIFRELLGPKWGTPEVLKNTNAMFVLDELEDKHIAFEEAKRQN